MAIKMDIPYTAALYLRKSRQDSEAESIEETLQRHKEQLTQYAIHNNIAITGTYEEVVSGESLYARPQMLKLLTDTESGDFNAVLCMDIDRLGRGKTSDQGIILETFKDNQIVIITPLRRYNLNDEIDEDYAEFEGFMAHRELKMIKRRLQRGIHKTLSDGGYIANAPYGYKKTKIDKRPTLEIYEPEARFVRMIFDMYVNQGMGTTRIAQAVNALGAKPHRTEEFGRTTIRDILKNPVYIGKICWDRRTHVRKGTRNNVKHITIYNPPEKWIIIKGIHPSIISEEMFEAAQKIRETRGHSPTFTGLIYNPVAGIAVCKNCGRAMTRQQSRKEPYLICPKPGCMAAAKIEYIEKAILKWMADTIQSLETESRKGNSINKASSSRTEAEALEKAIKTAKNQDSRLHDFLEQGVYDTETFFTRHRELTERIRSLTKKLEILKTSEQTEDKEKELLRLKRAFELYQTCAEEDKNSILKSIISRITYYKQKGSSPAEFTLSIEMKKLYL